MNKSRFLIMILITVLCFALFGMNSPASASNHARIDPALVSALATQPTTAQNSVIVIMNDQADLRAVRGHTRKDRQRDVVRLLLGKRNTAQRTALALLRRHQAEGKVQAFTSLWIMNAIAVTADSTVVNELAVLPGVREIALDVALQAPARTTATGTSSTSSTIQPNLNLINAPTLWNMGFTGQGIVVANLDTGVDATHPDLAGRWRGGSNSWYDPYNQHALPFDMNGHGTWTMGVMVAGNASGSAIGVAPNATWIAAKIYNDSGIATTSAIHQSFQWLLDPDGNPLTDDAPDVVNNSWALNNINGCDQTFQSDLQTLVAAGITPVFAAGNYGSSPSTSVSPPNNPAAFPVGAINNNNLVLSTSSRGPTSCGQSVPVTYPGVMAPGVNIRTTDLAGGYYTVSGTSLAAPHVAGGIALLLNAFPMLTVAQIEEALKSTAVDLGSAGPDNNYGMGRIDLLAAYQKLAIPAQTPTDTPTATTLPATDTPTATAIPATDTPTATATPIPPTATAMATPTLATATATAIPPTATATPIGTVLFSDGFETGGFGNWTSATTANGKLSVATAAALAGIYGMQAVLSPNTPVFVTDSTPNAESNYHARFWMNPNSAVLSSSTLDQFIGRSGTGTVIFRIQLRLSSGTYQVRGVAILNSGTTATTNWYSISNARHAIEVAWQAASTTNGSNGTISLWVDGIQKQAKTGLANGSYRVEDVRLGPSGGAGNGVSGTVYFDSFASNRTSYIGP